MPFWSSETVKKRVPKQFLIDPYEEGRVMRGAYELSVGAQAYITSNTGEKTRLSDGERIVIPPGQFGLLVTKETVRVPSDAMAFLSIKSTTKLQGLVNVSGFHVDPGYNSTLKFAVYNAGPQNIYLDQDQPMFLIWYAALDQVTEDLYKPRPGLSKDITAEDVKRIAGDVASPAHLKEQFDKLKIDFDKRLHELETESEKRLHKLETEAEQRLHDLESKTDKRVHTVETRQVVVQTVLVSVLIGLLMTIGGAVVKYLYERSPEKPPAAAQTAANQPLAVPAAGADKAIAPPAHLGFYILGASGIAGASVIVAAFIVRIRARS
jgi:dCTP deaminase